MKTLLFLICFSVLLMQCSDSKDDVITSPTDDDTTIVVDSTEKNDSTSQDEDADTSSTNDSTVTADSTDTDDEDKKPDDSSTGDGAVSGPSEDIDTIGVGDSIIGWDKITDEVIVNGEKIALTWVDHFDSSAVNKKRWSFGAWSFNENLSWFKSSQVKKNENSVSLVMVADTADVIEDKDYLSAEMYSRDEFMYGRYVCRMKPQNVSGVISSFFLIDTEEDWYEIDIEFVGENTRKVQLNLRSKLPDDKRIIDKPVFVNLPFDAAEDFHTYTIDWTEKYIAFYADGIHLYTYDDEEFVARQQHPQTVRFNYWPTNLKSWAGEFSEHSLPIETEYDYIAVYAKNVE